MATLRITFTPTVPAPANGYTIAYRKDQSGDPYLTQNTTASPTDITVDDGWAYEGYIRSNCTGTAVSTSVTFLAPISVESLYQYEFSKTTLGNITVYYNDSLGNPQTDTIVGGGTQLNITASPYNLIVGTIELAPGDMGSTLANGVTFARSF